MKALGRLGRGVGWGLVFLVSLVASLWFHLQLPEARDAVRQIVCRLASDALRGDLEIDRLVELSPYEVRAEGVRLLDAEGRTVISAPRVAASLDFGDLWRDGTIRIGSAHIEDADLALYVVGDDGLEMSFIRAFEPASPGPPGGEPLHLVIGNLVLDDVHAHGDVPRYPGLDVDGLDTVLRIEVDRVVTVDAYDATGHMVGPYPGMTEIDHAVVHFSTDWEDGLTGYLAVHRADARASADVRVDRPPGWGDEGPPHVSIVVHADPMCAGTLRSMGFPGLDALEGCARGWGRLEGPATDLALTGSFDTDAGHVDVSGRIASDEPMSFGARTDGLALSTLVPSAPDVHFVGSGTVTLVDDPDDPARALVTLSADAFEVGGYAIPGLDVRAAVTDDALLIEEVEAHHLAGPIEVRGRVGFDGSLDLHAHVDVEDVGADPNVARLVPGAHGAVRGDLSIDAGPGASDLTIDSTIDARGVHYGPIRAQSLRGRVWVRADGDDPLPELSLGLTGDGVSVSGVALGHATIEGHGGGERPLHLAIRSSGGADVRGAAIDATVTRQPDGTIGVTLDSTTLDVGLGDYVAVPGAHPRITSRGGRIQFEDLTLRSPEGAEIALSGTLAPSGESDLRIHLRDFELATIAPLLPPTFARLTGKLDADGWLRGRLADPDLDVSGNVHDASFDGQRGLAITHYDLHYLADTTTVSIEGDLGARGGVHVEGPIRAPWAVLTDPRRFFTEASFDGLELDLDRANLAFLTPFLGQDVVDLALAGRLTAAVVLSGHPADVDVPRAVLILDNFAREGWTPIRGKVQLSYVGDELRIERIWVADPLGELLLAEAGTHLSIADPPADLQGWLARLADAPWWVAARLEPRRLDAWPRPLGKVLPRGIVVGGSVTLMSDGRSASGSMEAVVRWDEPATPEPCAADLRPNFQIHAITDAEVTHFQLDGFVGGRDVVHASADAPTHLHEWLAAAYAELPETGLDVHVRELPLEQLPWTCPYATGVANGDLVVTLGTDEPALDGTLEVAGMRVRDPEDGQLRGDVVHAGMSFATEGRGEEARASVCLLLSEEDGPRTSVSMCPSIASLQADEHALVAEEGEVALVVGVPLAFEGRLSAPHVAWDAPLFVWADFENAHLAPLVVYVPGTLDADIVANGTIHADGPFDTAVLEGGLDLRDGHVRIASVGQHLHGIEGVLRMEPGRIVLPDDRPLVVYDGDGTTSVTGAIELEGLAPVHAAFTIDTDGFPVRREGATLASLSGIAHADTLIEDEGVRIDVRTEALEIALPPSLAGSVQSLDRRRDVLIVGEDAPEIADIARTRFPYRIHVDAPTITVTRNDFEASVRALLDVTYDDPNLYIGGIAEITNGTFEVLGKRFTVQRGAIQFDAASPEMDPDISLVAVYALPGRRGATITITVSGHLSTLAVDFSSTETSDTGEILALLVSGRTSRPQDAQSAQQAGDQAANFVAGLTAGILTLGLQQQFGGDFVPNVAIETGGLGSVGVRVGFNADWIIPDFMRDVVLDAYLEGFFGSASTQQQQQQGGGSGGVGGGASIELQLPFNGVLSGTYVPPTSWGADLVWEP